MPTVFSFEDVKDTAHNKQRNNDRDRAPRIVRRFALRRRVAYNSQCKEIKERYTKQHWDSFSADRQYKEKELVGNTINRNANVRRSKNSKTQLPFLILKEGQLANEDQEPPRRPPRKA
jgi:hypothetical protein